MDLPKEDELQTRLKGQYIEQEVGVLSRSLRCRRSLPKNPGPSADASVHSHSMV